MRPDVPRPSLPLLLALLAACQTEGSRLPSEPEVPSGSFSIAKLDGDGQSDTVLAALDHPLRVLVLRNGVPASAVSVSWSLEHPIGAGASLSHSQTFTDTSGIASVSLTLGERACGGDYSVLATVSGASASPARFTATARSGNAAKIVVASRWIRSSSGVDYGVWDRQVGVVGDTVHWSASVQDAHGNGVDHRGAVVRWSVVSGGGTVVARASETQDSYPCGSGGTVTNTLTLGPDEGDQVITAALAAVPAAPPATFTAVGVSRSVEVQGSDFEDTQFENRFVDDSTTISVGETVGWTWVCDPVASEYGGCKHNVTFEDDPTAPVSSDTQSEGFHTRRFNTAGGYRYRCTQHSQSFQSGMVGVVVVKP